MSGQSKKRSIILGAFTIEHDGAWSVQRSGAPVILSEQDARDLVVELGEELFRMGADLDDLRPALEHELRRSSDLLSNWTAAERAHDLRRLEWQRDRLRADELSREVERLKARLGEAPEPRAPELPRELAPSPTEVAHRAAAAHSVRPATARGAHPHRYIDGDAGDETCRVCGAHELDAVHVVPGHPLERRS